MEPSKLNAVRLTDLDEPTPLSDEVLLETLCVGIDGTDREINAGMYGSPPVGSSFLVSGHEALARVSELGEHVKGFSKGDLVVPTVRRPCVEKCINCSAGEMSACLTGNYYEHGIKGLHGFGSEFAVSDSDFLVKVPNALEEVAVLLEPLSVVERAIAYMFKIQQRFIWNPKRALVLGAGPLGILICLILRLKGLNVICAARTDQNSLNAEIIQSINAKYYCTIENPVSQMQDKQDIIIDATGSVDAVVEAARLADLNAILCFLGIYREQMVHQNTGRMLTKMVLGNRLMFGSVNSDKIHFEMGLQDLVELKKQYNEALNRIITGRLGVSDFKEAFYSREKHIKQVIYFK